MKKLGLVLFPLLLFIQCNNVTPKVEPVETIVDKTSDEVFSMLQPDSLLYTFDIEYNKAYAKGFISDYKIYSVLHLYDHDSVIDTTATDVIVLDTSRIQGLKSCKVAHRAGDILICVVQAGFLSMKIDSETTYYYRVLTNPLFRRGDSGSPVLCHEHRGVVGLVSGFEEYANGAWIGLIKSKPKVK